MFLFQVEGMATPAPKKKNVETMPQSETINRDAVSKGQNKQEFASFQTKAIAYVQKSESIPQKDKVEIIDKIRDARDDSGILKILEIVRDKYQIKDNFLDSLINQLKKATGTDNVDAGTATDQANRVNLLANNNQNYEEKKAIEIVDKMSKEDGFFKAV